MFRRVLVALDGSPSGRAAMAFAGEIAHEFDASVWLLQVAEHPTRRNGSSGRLVPQVDAAARAVDLQRVGITVSGATRAARDNHLVTAIAEEAARFDADVVVLGLDRRRLAHQRFSKALQEQVTRATSLPVMIAPAVAGDEAEVAAAVQPSPVGENGLVPSV
jgi:nucleotide-binding universal stress UspA family protein